jgi:hypothetical protein
MEPPFLGHSRIDTRLLCNLACWPVRNHSFRTLFWSMMTHFPRPHRKQRAIRVEFHAGVPAAIRFEDGRHRSGRLRRISLTGGLLHVSQSLVPGSLVEVTFISPTGSVLGVAELLSPASATLKCLQPFKFVMIDDDNYRRLIRLIWSSQGGTANSEQVNGKLPA